MPPSNRILFGLLFLALSLPLVAQQAADTSTVAPADSSSPLPADSILLADSLAIPGGDTLGQTTDSLREDSFLEDMQEIARVDSARQDSTEAARELDDEETYITRFQKLEQLAKELNGLERLLRIELDTTALAAEIQDIDSSLVSVEEAFAQYPDYLNYATLNAIEVFLRQIERFLEEDQALIVKTYQELLQGRERVVNLFRDVNRGVAREDPVVQEIFLAELNDLSNRWSNVIDDHSRRLRELAQYQRLITTRFIWSEDLIGETRRLVQENRMRMRRPEFPPIWKTNTADYFFSTKYALQQSFEIVGNVLAFYVRSNWGKSLIILVLIGGFYYWVDFNLRFYRRKADAPDAALGPLRYLDHFPRLASILPGLFLVPVIFGDSPRLILSLVWLVVAAASYPMVRKQWPARSLWIPAFLFILYFLSGLDQMLLFPTAVERWGVLVAQGLALILGIALVGQIRNLTFAYPWLIRIATFLFFLGLLASLFFNAFGYFSLAKLFLYTALTSLVFSFIIILLVKIIMEAFFLQSQREQTGSRFTFWFKYQDFEKRLSRIMLFVASLSWALITLDTGTLVDSVFVYASNLLNEPRSVGDLVFSWGDVLIFGFIIWMSTMLSSLIKYIFGPVKDTYEPGSKNQLVNYMLIIRLLILALGFLLALSAAGIPLDKVAIVLGALGLGIGFGLQNIVNNLVSGIILAFERPVKIGDTVEIDAELGKVKEIGIRASRITTFDGAEVIVPNGTLLSGRITNWTMSDSNRRIEVIAGVGYGSDIQQVKGIIQQVLKAHPQVLDWPKPLILVQQLDSSSVNFRVLFWTSKIDDWLNIQSDVLGEIYNQIRLAGIEIPFPKRDVKVTFQSNQLPGVNLSGSEQVNLSGSEQADQEDREQRESPSKEAPR